MKPATVLLVALFIDLVGFGIVLPILPFIVQSFGGDELAGGLIFAIYAAMAAVFGPLWGRLSDRIGRRRALLLTLLGAAVSYVVLGLADSLATVFLARALSGAMAGNVGVVMAAIADLSSQEERTRALGRIGVSFGLGFAAGPGLAAALSAAAGADALSLAGFAAATMSLIAFGLALTRLPETRPAPPAGTGEAAAGTAVGQLIGRPSQIPLLLQFVLSAVIQSMVYSMTAFWGAAVWDWGEREVGLLMVGVGLLVALIQGTAVGPLARRVGEVRAYILALSCNLLGCSIIVSLGDVLFAVLLAFLLMMSGMTLWFPNLNSLVSRRNPAHAQGGALGLANGLAAAGRVVGPMLGGWLMARYGPSAPFLASILLALLGLGWAVNEIRVVPRR